MTACSFWIHLNTHISSAFTYTYWWSVFYYVRLLGVTVGMRFLDAQLCLWHCTHMDLWHKMFKSFIKGVTLLVSVHVLLFCNLFHKHIFVGQLQSLKHIGNVHYIYIYGFYWHVSGCYGYQLLWWYRLVCFYGNLQAWPCSLGWICMNL